MAGYDGYSKSNNARQAEAEGRYTATALAKRLKCHSGAIPIFLAPSEYHHTSGWYNATDYYDEPLLIAVARDDVARYCDDCVIEPGDIEDEVECARRRLVELRAWKPAGEQRYQGCRVEWVEWGGTRKRPKAYPQKAEGVEITVKGAYITIHLATGDVRKKIGSNGTWYSLGAPAEVTPC